MVAAYSKSAAANGNNLISMAYALPESRFTGVDLADQVVAAGCEVVNALGLTNIALQAADLRTIGPELGDFDYIIAHGVYSWIAADARQRLLAICRERLRPQGVALVTRDHPALTAALGEVAQVKSTLEQFARLALLTA